MSASASSIPNTASNIFPSCLEIKQISRGVSDGSQCAAIAQTLHDQGELAEARSLQEQVLAGCCRLLGGEPDGNNVAK